MTRLWGLLWRLLVSALIVAIVLLALFLLKGDEDDWGRMGMDIDLNSVLLSSPPNVWTSKELGYLRSLPALAWPKPQAVRLTGAGGLAESPVDIPWRGLVVLPDFSIIYLDLEMAATQASVSFQESTWRCDAYRTTVVAGVTYEVLGLFQLLYDVPIRRLTEGMGYTKADLLRCKPNALVAQEWRRLTDKGVEWRLWEARPLYRTDGNTSGDY